MNEELQKKIEHKIQKLTVITWLLEGAFAVLTSFYMFAIILSLTLLSNGPETALNGIAYSLLIVFAIAGYIDKIKKYYSTRKELEE